MEEILDSVSHIDGQKDINSFVDDHQHLMTEMKMLQFEPHQCRVGVILYNVMTTYDVILHHRDTASDTQQSPI